MPIEPLPLTAEDLGSWVGQFELTAEALPFDPEEVASFDLRTPWPNWHVESRLMEWRKDADPRYEGLENEALAREAIEKGELPGFVADRAEWVDELFKDGSGNVYLQLEGVKTADGHEPVFFFDHDKKWKITACARNLVELHARQVVEAHLSANGYDREIRAILDAPIPLDPASLQPKADFLEDDWRAAIGVGPLGKPRPPRRSPQREVVTGAELQDVDELGALRDPWVSRFILARAVDAEALDDVLRPLTWWDVGTFTDVDAALRNIMARLLSLASQPPPEDASDRDVRRHKYDNENLLRAAHFLEKLYQHGEVWVKPSENAISIVKQACTVALKRITGRSFSRGVPEEDDGERLLDSVPPMLEFQKGWAGIVPDEVLAQGDHLAFATASELCGHLKLMQDTAYNLLRGCGDELVEPLEGWLERLLDHDRVMVLHALDNFPKNPDVLALYDRVIAETSQDVVLEAAQRYRDRVASGVKPSGWER